MNVLLTGASGALGAELVRSLARAHDDVRLHVLLRAANDDELRARATALRAGLDPGHAARIVPLAGDVTSDRLGFGARYDDLAAEFDEIYHAAACTRFDVPADVACAHNVTGTRHVLDLARAAQRAGRSGRLHFVSTAYVAGRRGGRIAEDELECGQTFFNVYEWSKFEAEREVRAALADLPVTIYRPGIVVGHSLTGWARRFLGVYQVLRWLDRGVVRRLPCRDDFQVDLTPADYVADAIVRIAAVPGSVGRTFHLTAGSGNTLSLGELVRILFAERDATEPARRPAGLTPPDFAHSRADARGGRLDPYVPYLTCAKTFDDGNTRALLSDLPVPSVRTFFPRVVRYALDSGFRAEAV